MQIFQKLCASYFCLVRRLEAGRECACAEIFLEGKAPAPLGRAAARGTREVNENVQLLGNLFLHAIVIASFKCTTRIDN